MKILVIEDNINIIDSISISLDVSWPNSTLISTHFGQNGIELVEKEKPDIVLLDIGLPDKNGFDVLKEIRAFSEVPVIILTVNQEEIDIVKGLSLGADDYIIKPFRHLELIARIKTILKRSNVNIVENLFFGKLCCNTARSTLSFGDNSMNLTPTENRIMQALMQQPGRIVSFNDMAEQIWGTDYPGSNNAIRVYIGRLRRKLESVSLGTIHISSQPGVGFLLESN